MEYNATRESEIHTAIVSVARQSFLQRGIENTQMNWLAREVGISRSTLYLYFPSKSDLVMHVSGVLMKEISQQADEYVAKIKAPDAMTALRRRLGFFLSYFKEHTEIIRFLDKFDAIYSDEYPNVGESCRYTAAMIDSANTLYALILQGQTEGSIRDDISPNSIGSMLLNSLFGIMQRTLTRKAIIEKEHNVHVQEVLDSFLDLMLTSIAK